MQIPDSRRASTHFGSAFLAPRESHTEDRLPLLVPGLWVLVVVAITVLLTGALAYWKGGGHALCTTPACGAFAQLLRASINESFSPCDNFGRFVCHGWRRSHHYSVNEEFYRVALATMSQIFQDVEVSSKNQNVKQQMAAFYRSCYILRASGRDDTPLVKSWLLEAGVLWPVRPANPNVLETLAFLALKLGWPAVLNIGVSTAGGDRAVVRLSPALAFHVVSTARLPKQKRMEYLGRLHHAFAPDDTTFVQSIVTFEDTVRIEDTLLPDLVKVSFYRQLNHINASSLHRSAEEWYQTILKFRRSGSQVSFQTAYPRFIETFVRLWKTQGEEGMHLFVSWYAVRFAAHFAHESLVNPLSSEILGGGAFYRGLLCLVPLYFVMGDLTFGVYNALVWSTRVRLDVKALVLSVREAFSRLLSANANFAPGARLLSSWSSISSVFSVLDYSTESSGLWKNPLRGIPDFGEVFALNWVAARQAIAQNELHFTRSVLPKTLLLMHLVEEDFRARDFVLVPFALAHPMYDVASTAAVKYGGLGSHVALASARIVLNLYGGEGAVGNTTARNHLRAFRECLEADPVGAPGLGDVAEELVALTALLRAFRHADDADGRRLGGLPGFSSAQLFFIAWCFMRCSVSRQPEEDEVDPCSPALSHVEDFSEAFRCGRYTALNPEQRCRLL